MDESAGNRMKNIYIAEGAHVEGEVVLGDQVGIWYNAVIRGDSGKIEIGDRTNVQDNCTIHTDVGHNVKIGKDVSIGHNAIVHGCTVGDGTLIGMGSILLSGAVIGANCIVGAGALVTGKMNIPDGSLVFGNPAKIMRTVTEDEIRENKENIAHYVALMKVRNQ